MVTLNPMLVVLALVVFGLGIVIHLVRKSSTLHGYEDVAGDAQRLQRALKGETFRDGSDLVCELPISMTFEAISTVSSTSCAAPKRSSASRASATSSSRPSPTAPDRCRRASR